MSLLLLLSFVNNIELISSFIKQLLFALKMCFHKILFADTIHFVVPFGEKRFRSAFNAYASLRQECS